MGPNSSLHVTLLDGFEVRVGPDRVQIKGARCRQVLAYLILNEGSTVSVDRLSEALWGERLPNSARNSIQRFVSDLRRDLRAASDRVQSADNGYRLEMGAEDFCDALELERAVHPARQALADGRPRDARQLVGDDTHTPVEPLASIDGAAFAAYERERLSELIADRGEIGVDARLAEGDVAEAITAARQLLAQHRYRERLWIALATGLTRSGRANDALEALATCRSCFRTELGLEPSPAIEQIELDILLHRDAQPLDALPSTALRKYPDRPSRLLGRSELIAHAVELLETKRVVTLTGTSGIGKTSAASDVIELWRLKHGGETRFVSLEGIGATGIATSVGQVVGTSNTSEHDPLGEVVDRIGADVDLLILDNCEHIAEAVGSFVDEIVKRTTGVRVLSTSRRPLGKVYEQLLPLKPLGGEASRALLKRGVEEAGLDFALLDDDAVRALLDEVDGLPLAIELAGAGLRSAGVRDLLSRWREDDEGTPHLPMRHRSIANAVRSSLDQLGVEHLELLGLCSSFPADFDVDAITEMAGHAAVPKLRTLVDHSLLEVDQSSGTQRYRMLVPIRAEVRSQAAPFEQGRRRAFISHYTAVAFRRLHEMKGTESLAGVVGLRTELTNIAAAFNFAAEDGDVSSMATIVHCVGLANGMSPAVGAKSHLRDWGERLRARCSDSYLDPDVVVKARTAVAWGLYGSGDGAWYLRLESETRVGDVETQAMASIARFSCGESTEAWGRLRELDLETVADPYVRAMLCGVGAVIAFEVGAPEGNALCQAAKDAARVRLSHGAAFFAALACSSQALVRGDVDLCARIVEEAAATIDGHGLVTLENMGLASVAMTVGFILRDHDPTALLVGLLDRYLEQHSLDPASVAMALDVAVLHLDSAGATDQAAMLLGLLDRLGLSMAILRGPRSGVEAKIAAHEPWAQARLAGSRQTTFAVLRSTRSALVETSRR